LAFLDPVRSKSAVPFRRIIFTEGEDSRILKAARDLANRKIGIPVILGNPGAVRGIADKNKLPTHRIRIMHPRQDPHFGRLADICRSLIKQHKPCWAEFEILLSNPLYYGILSAGLSKEDICITGINSEIKDILKTALEVHRMRETRKRLSSFAVVFDREKKEPMFFADCAINPGPGADQLADIAADTANNFNKITGEEPRTAFLSFATSGSAKHEMTVRVREAKRLFKAINPDLIAEGEIQFDAAFVSEIGLKKSPHSELKKPANVFIFPSLNAGNISLHLVRHLTGYRTLGPFFQGGMENICCIHPACSEQDIIDTVIVAQKRISKNRFGIPGKKDGI
jgi:phosphotransacetylase